MNIEQAESRTILKILAGSHVHGLNVETSDRDEDAIIIEPMHEAMGLQKPFEDLVRMGEDEGTGIDIKYVSLRKWCHLACKGNPNFLLMLFALDSHIIKCDSRGQQLRDMAPKFISKQVIKSHLGYMQGQRNRLLNHNKEFATGGGHGKPRFDLVAKHGYDTKFAMHLLRLGYQGVELAKTGKLTLPLKDDTRAALMKVRAGDCNIEWVLSWADALEAEMKDAFDTSDLPDEPNYAEIETWMCRQYLEAWSVEGLLAKQFEELEFRGVDIRRH